MTTERPALLRRHPSGKVNPVSVLLIVGVTLAGWYGYYVVPVYYDNLDCREVLEQAVNVGMIEGVDRGKAAALAKLNISIGSHYQVDEETGVEREVPGLGIDPENLVLELDQPAKRARGHLEYDRVVQLKPLQRRKVFHFSLDREAKLQ